MPTKSQTESALQIAKEHTEPEICKELSPKMKAFAESYLQCMNINTACKETGYSKGYGFQLLRDVRIQSYLSYLREIYNASAIISKGQIVEKIGQRILSNDIEDKDLASLSREARYLLDYGTDKNFNTQINIQLPDTYRQFLQKPEKSINDAIDTEEWEDIDQSKEE